MLIASLLAIVAAKNQVVFHLDAPAAKEVSIAGDLTGWSTPKKLAKGKNGWNISFDLAPDARFEYKFIVDGNWILDPGNKKMLANGVGGENSVYEGPKYALHTLEQTPTHPLTRRLLNVGGRDIIVYTPDQSAGLPMFVYGDGQNYEAIGKIQNVVENLVEAKKIKPVILVLIPPVDRMKEYGSDWRTYAGHLFNEWLPAVREATGASTAAKDLYVGGSSMGGVISMRLAEEFPDKVAGGVHSQSGAFLYDAPGIDFHDIAETPSLRKIAKGTRLWFCWGAYEGSLTKANEKLVKTLKQMGIPFAQKTTNEGHNWTAWRNRMEEALTYLLSPKS